MSRWVGRFAPTPSGPLHFGSLVAAVASYLIARQAGGLWLLRIEDIDKPREVSGAASSIIQTLAAFGFSWDQEISYQSQRQIVYQQALQALEKQSVTYACDCSRKQVAMRSDGIYDGFCRDRRLSAEQPAAVRVRFAEGFETFEDYILGRCQLSEPADTQDFVIRRRDGLFAYQLAVVADDIAQGVNHVVRGADILDSTPRQNFLYHCLNQPAPAYYHLPLVLDQAGEKLSKSKFSPAISSESAGQWLIKALRHLGQPVTAEMQTQAPAKILEMATGQWQLSLVPRQAIRYPS